MKIKETIVVEGRDDTIAIRRSVDALTVETHGFGIRPDTWTLIEKAYETTGIIVFTDPDHAGEQIRKRIMERFPGAKEAFLDSSDAEKNGDIGIENASPESIMDALMKCHASVVDKPVEHENYGGSDSEKTGNFTEDDMFFWGLAGTEGAGERRKKLGKKLGIGFANAKTFLKRIVKFGLTREEIEEALREL